MLRLSSLLILATLPCTSLAAQHHHGAHSSHHQPYAGLERRRIKALSDEQLADLRAGKGMGLAMAAELNGYPGPMHVLELAGPLKLSDGQKARIEAQFAAMKAEAVVAGEAVIGAEATLDALFASGKADADSLDAAMHRLGHARMVLRRTHLAYHLTTKAALSEEQVAAYARLRGYAPQK